MVDISEKLKLLPDNPGVYVMLDSNGVVIYVGKAKNLKNRVRQYFFNNVKTLKVSSMVKNIADFYYIITPTEIDALSLENNLIKKHKPRYNILLKDDKTYPYIKVNLKENYPSFKVVRKVDKDGCKYFGPYMGGVNVKAILETLNLAFGVRPCTRVLPGKKAQKPCLNYHIKRCSAPCCEYISDKDYLERVHNAVEFLCGETQKAHAILTKKMQDCASNEDFEGAIKYKEAILGLDKIGIKRLTNLGRFINADVISSVSNGIYSAVNLLHVRNGRMLGSRTFSFESASLLEKDVLREFILRFYSDGSMLPEEIIVGHEIDDKPLILQWLKNVHLKSVKITLSLQGVKKQLVQMSEINAKEYLDKNVDKIKHKQDMTISACKLLQEKLGLKNYPKRMECFDVSNISGVDKVASMVVFINGQPEYESYRRFKIKTVEGIDDFKSMQEVLERRLDRLGDEKFAKPDLIVIDGGKGQLSSVMQVINDKGIRDVDVISLAEREEEIFLPNQKQSVVLSKKDYCLKLLIRIRDEAHRFAITYHRVLRGKRALSSILDNVKGLGKVKKTALLNTFKDVSGIASASIEQLKSVQGIGEKQANDILQWLKKEGLK